MTVFWEFKKHLFSSMSKCYKAIKIDSNFECPIQTDLIRIWYVCLTGKKRGFILCSTPYHGLSELSERSEQWWNHIECVEQQDVLQIGYKSMKLLCSLTAAQEFPFLVAFFSLYAFAVELLSDVKIELNFIRLKSKCKHQFTTHIVLKWDFIQFALSACLAICNTLDWIQWRKKPTLITIHNLSNDETKTLFFFAWWNACFLYHTLDAIRKKGKKIKK